MKWKNTFLVYGRRDMKFDIEAAERYPVALPTAFQPEILASNHPANYTADRLRTASNRLRTACFQPPRPPSSWKLGLERRVPTLRWRYGYETPLDKPSSPSHLNRHPHENQM